MKLLIADRAVIGDGERVLNQAAIVLDNNGKIKEMGTETELLERFPQAQVSRYEGCTILPGLIDLHVHVGYPWKKEDYTWKKSDQDKYKNGLNALMASSYLKEALSLGVTTVRDVGSPDGLLRVLKEAIEKGYIAHSPRFFGVNQPIGMTGGHASSLDGISRDADGPWDMRTAVREQIKAGADWIKITIGHREPTPEHTQEELDAAIDEVHRLGRKCCVHAALQPAIPMAIQAGVDTIEHGTFMTVEQAKQMAEKGIIWVPTMMTFFELADYFRKMEQQTFSGVKNHSFDKQAEFFKESEQAYRENFAKLMETGVKIATGTDIVLDGYPITPVSGEVGLMVDLGMEPIRAIQAATQTPAQVLDIGHEVGLLAPDLMCLW